MAKRKLGRKSKARVKVSGVGKIGVARKLRSKRSVGLLFFGVGILIVALVYLTCQSFGVFESSSPQEFDILDECSLIMGNLVHQIRDGAECRIKCVNECDVREMEFVEFVFSEGVGECNSCDCWCE